MSRLTAHQREVRNFLRDEYGARDFTWGHGGSHPWVEFNYAGRRLRELVPARMTGRRALDNALAGLRRKLGPRPASTMNGHRCARNLEEMTKEMTIAAQQLARELPATPPTAPSNPAWSVDGPAGLRFSSSYKLVTVQVADDVFNAFNRTNADRTVGVLVVNGSDPLRLEISHDPARKTRFAKVGQRWQVQAGAKDLVPLGDVSLTPARATYANGKITVVVTEPLRRPVKSGLDVSTLPADHLVRLPLAADFLGISLQALQRMRASNTGPAFVRLSTRTVGYRVGELRAYKEEAAAALAPRRLVPRAKFEEKIEQHFTRAPAAPPDLNVRAAEAAGIVVTSNTDDLHAILTNLTRVERETPYRLVKLNDGSWAFRAPTIKL